ncbi:MAG TPA: hypothetical protein ENI75_02240 [Mizugakiibacter sp.]|nr:hypothetical protein [Mizugakiibacter sp.]
MRTRIFILQPPTSKLGRILWLLTGFVLLALVFVFGFIIAMIILGVLSVAFLVRQIVRPRGPVAPPSPIPPESQGSEQTPHIIEGEFVVIRDKHPPSH